MDSNELSKISTQMAFLWPKLFSEEEKYETLLDETLKYSKKGSGSQVIELFKGIVSSCPSKESKLKELQLLLHFCSEEYNPASNERETLLIELYKLIFENKKWDGQDPTAWLKNEIQRLAYKTHQLKKVSQIKRIPLVLKAYSALDVIYKGLIENKLIPSTLSFPDFSLHFENAEQGMESVTEYKSEPILWMDTQQLFAYFISIFGAHMPKSFKPKYKTIVEHFITTHGNIKEGSLRRSCSHIGVYRKDELGTLPPNHMVIDKIFKEFLRLS